MIPFRTLRHHVVASVLAGSIGLLGCANRPPAVSSSQAETAEPVAVHVENDHTAQATVHVRYEGGEVQRLGAVRSFDGATFRLARSELTGRSIQLIAEMLAGRNYVTEELLVNPGNRVEFTIASPLYLSSVMIR